MDLDSEFGLAQVVRSKAGRDKGKYFIILRSEKDYSFIANGSTRKTDVPKKKKNKHLQSGFGLSHYVLDKLSKGEKVTNSELRKELDSLGLN